MVFCFYNCSGHTVRKNCSSDLENCLKFKAEGREFARFLRSLRQFIVSYCISFTPFFTEVCIVKRLILQTIYVINKKILQILSLKSAVYN